MYTIDGRESTCDGTVEAYERLLRVALLGNVVSNYVMCRASTKQFPP